MRQIIVLLIKAYWLTFPPSKRRKCIFRISCSQYVYEITRQKGFIEGLKAFKYRFNNCRTGIQIIENHKGKIQIILPNSQVLEESEIAERFLKNKIYGKIHY